MTRWQVYVVLGALAGGGAGSVVSWNWEASAVASAAGALSGGIFSLAQARAYKTIAAIVLAAVLGMSVTALAPDRWLYASKFRDADEVISRIEDFRTTRGYLPATLSDIGRADDERGPLFYNRWSEDRYIVSFSAPRYGFFGSLGYDSASKMWQGHD